LKARVDSVQDRNRAMLNRGQEAVVALIAELTEARQAGATDQQLQRSRELQRKAQWRLDYIAAENSMGFHAPQEAARVLGMAADLARQGQIAALRWKTPAPPPK
jgi:nitrite reductase (cytochrome c-552)